MTKQEYKAVNIVPFAPGDFIACVNPLLVSIARKGNFIDIDMLVTGNNAFHLIQAISKGDLIKVYPVRITKIWTLPARWVCQSFNPEYSCFKAATIFQKRLSTIEYSDYQEPVDGLLAELHRVCRLVLDDI